MISLKRTGLIAFILLSTIFSSAAMSQQEVRITNGEWAPYLSEHLPGYGIGSQIVTEAFERVGYKVTYGFFPWARAYDEAVKGEDWNATIIWTKSSDREELFNFSEPLIKLKDVFFHLKKNNFDWQAVDDLTNYSLGLTTSYFYGQDMDDAEKAGKLNVERVRNDVLSMRKLLRGRIDAFAASEHVGYKLIKDNFQPIEVEQITNHSKPVRVVNYYMMMSKNAPNSETMVAAFNQGLAEMEEEGRIEEIISTINNQ